jgi:tetratricopeptide (TPR) repeat protein
MPNPKKKLRWVVVGVTVPIIVAIIGILPFIISWIEPSENTAGPGTNERQIIQRAERYADQGRLTDALAELEKTSTDNYDAWMLKGRIYLLAGLENRSYYEQAEEVFRKATKTRPDDGTAWHQLGLAEFNVGKVREARESFLKAMGLETNLLGTRYMLGLSHYEAGELEKAKSEWKGLAKRKNLSTSEKYFTAKAHLGLAYVFAKEGDSPAAVSSIEKSLLASISTRKKDDTEAIRKTVCADIRDPVEPLSHLDKTTVSRILMKHVGKGC